VKKRPLPKIEIWVSKTEVRLKSLSQSQVVHLSYEWSWANITLHYEIIRSKGDDATVTFTKGFSSVWPYIFLPKRPEESCIGMQQSKYAHP